MTTLRLIEKDTSSQVDEELLNARCSLQFRDFKVRYDSKFCFESKTLDVQGNVIAVLGHNGAGKSTLIKSILGLLPTLEGSLKTSWANREKTIDLRPEKHMAFCPETGSVFSDISVESYVKLWCRIKHNQANFYRRKGARYIELLDIEPLFAKLGRELSKGQRRRVQTAIGFLTNPKLFLFDEPFDGLDVQKTHELVELIESHKQSMSFIISSHRMDVVERLADTLIVLREGKILTHGKLEMVCHDMAGQSLFFDGSLISDSIISILSNTFPNLLINRIGRRLSLTGKNINQNALESVLGAHNVKNIKFESAIPNLVDAMNYHLRNHGPNSSIGND